ncbi:FAD/NAD(P)-binding protein [Corynebacterium propinquum]|uniref:FAD/NAD(P)-binding protein n=1 Tax=Corynebacterium propinquum TaxID=43769 RepID=A0AAP4BWB0_9CORY|nr:MULTISPECIES: FAD/NAD(P)-binding protein [Corynebacterium]MDK4327148.1 FAD/NAD(P)-binding protein [Corynebacterium propinquum]MDK4327713.1 FAD/NAD(P)-binding protein [Corynebacterium pseudodiphtheriticum]
MTHIAIIGGGASAVSVLAHLDLDRNDVVTVLSHHRLGPGRAYGEREKSALLNRPTYKMSVSNHDPNSFVSWLDRHHPNENREYVPRFFYGEYLKDYVQEVEASSAFRFSNIECDVKSLVKKNDGYAVEFQDARGEQVSIEVDQVVLALGAIVPGNPYDLVNDGGYFSDVYPMSNWVNTSASSKDVAVLGCGLSAFDAVLAAANASRETRITLYSRRGVAPDVRSPVFNIKPDPSLMAYIESCSDAGIGMEQFYQLVERLCAKHEITLPRLMRAIDLLRRDPEQRFSDMYDAPASVDSAVQGYVLDLAQNYITPAWALMDDACRESFLNSYHTVFQSFANPIPSETGRAIGRLCRTGRLRFRSGIQAVSKAGNLWNLECADTTDTVNMVVNTTKTTFGVLAPEADYLIRNMVECGLVARDPFGGILINPLTNRVVSPNGYENEGLFAIGECTVGSLYYISAMTKIRNRAQSIACALAAGKGASRV